MRDVGYGFFRPDNPHDFTPDSDSTPEQLEAHRLACEAYDKGEYTDKHPSGWITPDIHITTAPWGMGSYVYDRPEFVTALEALEVIESELTQLRRIAGARVMAQLLRDANRYEALRAKHLIDHPRMTADAFDALADGLTVQKMMDTAAERGVQPCDGNHGGPACEDENCWHKPPPYVQRMVKELAELNERIAALKAFMTENTEFFEQLADDEKQDLRQQFINMSIYSDVLTRRVMRATATS